VASDSTLSVFEAADELGVAPARVRSLLASGALTPSGGDAARVLTREVADLRRRGAVRSVDVAAVEGALDRALRRRLPLLLEQALQPLSSEVATTMADVEASARQLAAAEERARVAEQALAVTRAELTALQARPTGMFRRRRVGSAATA
jgi:hypothetical protein